MRRYEKMKDSGVEWMGKIPEHWHMKKLKYVSNLINDKVEPSKGDIKISPEYVEPFIGKVNNLYSQYSGLGMQFKPGDTLFNKLRVYLAKVVFAEFEGLSMGEMIVIRPYKIYPKFQFYLLLSSKFIDWCNICSYGVKQPRTPPEAILNSNIPIPPKTQQIQIAAFLDEKTAKIDSLIGKKERKIELLREKRKTLINHAVTKGLNPDVPMKDSGVEWIGEIPEEWDLVSLRRYCDVQQGLQIKKNVRLEAKVPNSYEYITTASIHNSDKPREYILNPKQSVICNKDDILFGRTGNTGEVITNVSGVFHNNFFKINFDRTRINKEYFYLFLINARFREHILLLAGTTTIPDLNHNAFLSCKMPLPSIDEQIHIVNYISIETGEIDELIKKEQQKIDLLKKYRQSLVSEAVTGKIDVREEVTV